jgi:hypothetical protein
MSPVKRRFDMSIVTHRSTLVSRRDLLKLAPLTLAASATRNSSGQMVMLPGSTADPLASQSASDSADITLRMKVTIHVTNETDTPEFVQRHGLLISAGVDGILQ